jgi:hypothetical protein
VRAGLCRCASDHLLALGTIGQSASGYLWASKSARNGRHSFGALVGMNGGQTLWMAPVDGKIRLFVKQDYVVPRKNGFWRVRAWM